MRLAGCQTKHLMYCHWLGVHVQLLGIYQHRTHQEKRSGGKVIRDIIRVLHWMPLQHLGRHILENPYEQVIS